MKYAYSLFLMLIFCAFCKGQGKTVLAKGNVKSEANNVDTSRVRGMVRTIQLDSKGNIWIASFAGVFRYDGKTFTNVTRGVSSARFISVLEDRKGNFWFSSVGDGVYCYDGISLPTGHAGFQHFTTDNGLLNNEVLTIYEDKTGNIWFGGGGGASRYDGKSFRNYIVGEDSIYEDQTGKIFPNSLASPCRLSPMIEDKTGRFWFTGGCDGVATVNAPFVYDGKTFTPFAPFTYKSGKPFGNFNSIIEDKSGAIWLGGSDGLWRYDGSTETKLTWRHPGYIYEDRNGNIWTGSRGGVLSRYEAKSLSNVEPTVTEIINPEVSAGMIFTVLEASDGSIWFGGLEGVFRYDGNTVTKM